MKQYNIWVLGRSLTPLNSSWPIYNPIIPRPRYNPVMTPLNQDLVKPRYDPFMTLSTPQ